MLKSPGLRLAMLLVTIFLISSVSIFAEGKAEVSETATGTGEPQYGGTLTIARGFGEAPTADMAQSMWPTVYYTNPVIDFLIIGDFEKYDARGTNEFPFWVLYTTPEEYCRGLLAESWEVTADKIVFHIRPGVFWAAKGKEHVMESREYTAYDTEYSLNRFMESPAGQGMLASASDWIKRIYAQDKYTCVVETNYFNARWKWTISTGWGNGQYARESVEAGLSDWNNLVGTGPWLLKEYVLGSAFIYEKNPIFWDKTVIDGKEYKIPFIDEVHYPIITDESTRMAALRTGKLDYMTWVSPEYEETLAKSSPELVSMPFVGYHMNFIALRMNDVIGEGDDEILKPTEILGKKDVRRALMMGLDRQTIMEATVIEGDIYGWPINGDFKSVYTPVSELPASTQEIFEYDQVRAKKILADAGYPDGFTLKMILTAGQNDVASLIVDMWSEIGVVTDMQVLEDVAWENARRSREGYDVLIRGEPTSDPLVIYPAIFTNGKGQAVYSNDYVNTQYDKAAKDPDVNVRNTIFKELGVIVTDEVPYIPLATGYSKIYYWPWLKNYYGLIDESAWGTAHYHARLWIDQGLKKELGY